MLVVHSFSLFPCIPETKEKNDHQNEHNHTFLAKLIYVENGGKTSSVSQNSDARYWRGVPAQTFPVHSVFPFPPQPSAVTAVLTAVTAGRATHGLRGVWRRRWVLPTGTTQHRPHSTGCRSQTQQTDHRTTLQNENVDLQVLITTNVQFISPLQRSCKYRLRTH